MSPDVLTAPDPPALSGVAYTTQRLAVRDRQPSHQLFRAPVPATRPGALPIHTHQGAAYLGHRHPEELLFHDVAYTSLDEFHAGNTARRAARPAHREYVATYARDRPEHDDLVETILQPPIARPARRRRDHRGALARGAALRQRQGLHGTTLGCAS